MVRPKIVRHLVGVDVRPRHHVSPVLAIRILVKRAQRPARKEEPAVQVERRPEQVEPRLHRPKGGRKRQAAENPAQSRVKRAKEPEKIE